MVRLELDRGTSTAKVGRSSTKMSMMMPTVKERTPMNVQGIEHSSFENHSWVSEVTGATS